MLHGTSRLLVVQTHTVGGRGLILIRYSDWEADPALQSFLDLLPLDVKDAILTCARSKFDALMLAQSNGFAGSNLENGRYSFHFG